MPLGYYIMRSKAWSFSQIPEGGMFLGGIGAILGQVACCFTLKVEGYIDNLFSCYDDCTGHRLMLLGIFIVIVAITDMYLES